MVNYWIHSCKVSTVEPLIKDTLGTYIVVKCPE